MPQIPVYQSQSSTGGVPQTPRATADDFGAQTSRAIVGLTQAGLDLADTVIKTRHAAETSRGEKDATQKLKAVADEAEKDNDFAAVPGRFTQGFDTLRANYARMSDSAFRIGALRVLDEYGPALGQRVRINAVKREAAFHRGNLDDDVEYYAGQAATASNDLERQINVNFAKAAIARANAAGYISKDDALARLRALPGRIEEQQADALIARDPAAAEQALDDPKRFRNLDEAQHDLLCGKATLARQKASFAAVGAVAAGLVDGSKTQFDVDRLQQDGAIGAAVHAWLIELAEKAAKEHVEKAEGVRRVDAVLHEGGRLDPKKTKDRAAADAYFDSVVAPGNPNQATLVAYVERIGMVPEGLVKRLKGGLASDDPQQVVNAASLIGALGKADARLVEGLRAKRLNYAKAVTAGVDGALSAERAVELADKRHGRPDVGDDGGTHGADAGGGTADESEKTKGGEAEDDRNAKGVSGDNTKVGNVSGGKDDSATAGADAAGNTSETVGSEIAPVGGTEDTTDKVAEPDMVDRFWRRLVEAAEPETHGRVGLTEDDRRFLVSLGLFRSGNEGQFNPLVPIRAIFETLINGGGQAADLVGRFGRALGNMTGAAVGQIAREVGASETQARRVEREFNAVAQVLALFSTYLGNIPGIPRAVEPGAATHAPGRVAAGGKVAETRTPRGATETAAGDARLANTRPTSKVAPPAERYRESGANAFAHLDDGSVDFGQLSPDAAKAAGMDPGPIRLQRGWDDPGIQDGAGEIHIEARHGVDIRNFKDAQGRQIYADAADLVRDVAAHYNRIARGHSGRLILGMTNGKEKIIIIELDRVGDGYVVRTAGLRNKGWMENPIRALPWRRTDPSVSRGPSDPGTQGSEK